MAETHRDFKSIHHKIRNADDIYDAVGTILIHQRKFQKRFPPCEADKWTDRELEDFNIDVENIDRLYHVQCREIDDGVEYELAARMDYGSQSLYLHVQVSMTFNWDGLMGEGEIYMTFDGQMFLKSIINISCNPRGIWESMVEDGHTVEEPTEFDLQPVKAWKSVPMLKFLCHMTVYQQQECLRPYFRALPHPLARGLEEFLKVRRTRDHRDEDFDTYPDYFGVYLSSSLFSR